MNDSPTDPTSRHSAECGPAGLKRPRITFETITFSSGTTLAFDDDSIVVFVGPNNAGKSAALRELQNFVANSGPQNVIKGVALRKDGTPAELRRYLEAHALRTGDDETRYHYSGIGYNISLASLAFMAQTHTQPLASFFCTRIATESRITASNPAEMLPLYRSPPTHPIHLLMMDDKLARKISDLFRHAFGSDLFVFRAGGGQFPLYVGNKPSLAVGEDELSRSFVLRVLSDTVPLSEQGDGMRSFATVLLHVLVADHHSIQFLDEPEAFLHPPQARLIGEFIARERTGRSQLFIATHSSDILDGLIAGGAGNVRVIRLQRDGAVNRVRELSNEKTAAVQSDTLARYSGVLDGIFYQHVVICESDADCLFYSSILNTRAVSGDRRADVHFIHASGKHRMSLLVGTLRSLDVPVSVISDIDLLREENALRELFEALGGAWSEISGNFEAIKTSVERQRPPLIAAQVTAMIEEVIRAVPPTGPFPKASESRIRSVFKTLSAWDDLKRAGRSALPAGQTVKHFDHLAGACAAVGLWIVPVGELEGFCRSADGGHGPSFVAKVLEEHDLEGDPELEEARTFVAAIWERAKPREAVAASAGSLNSMSLDALGQ